MLHWKENLCLEGANLYYKLVQFLLAQIDIGLKEIKKKIRVQLYLILTPEDKKLYAGNKENVKHLPCL